MLVIWLLISVFWLELVEAVIEEVKLSILLSSLVLFSTNEEIWLSILEIAEISVEDKSVLVSEIALMTLESRTLEVLLMF